MGGIRFLEGSNNVFKQRFVYLDSDSKMRKKGVVQEREIDIDCVLKV